MSKSTILIGRATRTGLGMMTLDFHREMRPDATILIDTGNLPLHVQPFCDAGGNVAIVPLRAWQREFAEIIRGHDLAVGFETFYSDFLPAKAKDIGVKTACFLMHECSPRHAVECDVVLCPSEADKRFFPLGLRVNWPVSGDVVAPRAQEWPPKIFIHNAGHLGGHGRNNTREVLAAAEWLIGTDAKLVVHSQEPVGQWVRQGSPVEVRGEVSRRSELYEGDVFVFPMAFEGLSLPLLEAAANGLPTIVLGLPEWPEREWPYRVASTSDGQKRFARRIEVWRPDVDDLGGLMYAMASGMIVGGGPARPPRPATWVEFREFWEREVLDA